MKWTKKPVWVGGRAYRWVRVPGKIIACVPVEDGLEDNVSVAVEFTRGLAGKADTEYDAAPLWIGLGNDQLPLFGLVHRGADGYCTGLIWLGQPVEEPENGKELMAELHSKVWAAATQEQ